MREVKAVIFDIGATLVTGPPVAPNKVIAAMLSPELVEGSKDATAAEIASVIMTRPFGSAGDVCAALESRWGPLDEATSAAIADLWESQSDAAQELDGASETVRALKALGLKIGLLSDIWSPYYDSVTRAIPSVIEAADAIVLSFQTGFRKPNPENFLRIVGELQVGVEEAVMVGDTYEHDILPAIKLGMRTVWVLARPDREAASIIRVLNGHCPSPTSTVSRITEVVGVCGFPLSTLHFPLSQGA